jgi:hypothetical protein
MPNARGLETPPLALIQHLRHNLTDRYPLDSVTKEILQNAEDARATSIQIGWTPGLPGSQHPLLRGPALFTVNNGEFQARDAEAICQFGLNFKAADRSAIGRFGLGLKSVFHLCEAFFYLSSAQPHVMPAKHSKSIVNPWLGTSHHGDWNEFKPFDEKLIRQHVEPLLSEPHWFCLWIPLRQKIHCQSAAPIRSESFPGECPHCPGELLADDKALFLAEQLPLLRYLRSISVWDRWDGPCSAGRPLLMASVRADSGGRSWFPDPLPEPIGSSGTIVLNLRGLETEMTYALWQGWLGALQEYRNRPDWPHSESMNDDGQPKPEKAEPHCAVCLTRRPVRSSGRLTMSTAVFFPLRDAKGVDPKGLYPCDDQAEYSLKLHGCFFVDAGRGKPTMTGDGLTVKWNRRLHEEGVCPLVIPAVAELAAATGVNAVAMRALTAAIEGSDRFRENREQVCSAAQWAYRWRPEALAWEKVPTDVVILPIPDPESAGPDLPKKVLPGLAGLAERYVLSPSGWKPLSRKDVESWPVDALEEALLDADPGALFAGNGQGWVYLRQFVKHAGPVSRGPGATCALAQLIRRTFAHIRTSSLQNYADDIRAVLEELPPADRLSLRLPRNWSEKDRQAVLQQPVAVVVVPEEFDPKDRPAAARLTTEDAVQLLTILQAPTERSKNSSPARNVLAAAEDGEAALTRCAHMPLWQGERITNEGHTPEVFSYAQLLKTCAERLLFAGSAATVPAATPLASALANQGLLLLPRDTAEVLSIDAIDLQNDASALLSALEGTPPLADPDRRVGLLRHVLKSHPDETQQPLWRQATRYLLHGHPGDVRDSHSLLTQRSEDSVWARLVGQGLSHQGGEWRMVPQVLARELNPRQQQELGIREVDHDGALEILLEVGPQHFDWTLLMEVLAELSDAPSEAVTALADAAWLPMERGPRRLAPRDLIHLEPLEDDIEQLVAMSGGKYASVSQLHPDVKKYRGFRNLARLLFPVTGDALLMLGELLGTDPRNHIGSIPVSDEEALSHLLQAFQGAPTELLAGVAWIANSVRATSCTACVTSLVPKLCREVSADQLVNILAFRAEQHKQRPADREILVEVHAWYLQAFSESAEFKQLLPNIRLLSECNHWKSPADLCLGAVHVDPDCVLHQKQTSVLRGKVSEAEPEWRRWFHESATGFLFRTQGQLESDLESTMRTLKNYFEPWTSIDEAPEVVRAIIGGFLCLLGDHPKLKEMAGDYLGHRSIEQCRANMGLTDDNTPSQFRLMLETCQGDSVEVLNLLGGRFTASAQADPDDLFIGYGIKERKVQLTLTDPTGRDVVVLGGTEARIHFFQWRKIAPESLSFVRLKKLLMQAGERILRDVHGLSDTGFAELLDDLSKTDQLDIRVAQNLLLDSAPFYLRQLRLGRQGQLRTILKNWDGAHDRRAEEEEARASGKPNVANKGLERLRETKEYFKQLLESDQELRREILNALRTKLTEYGYSPSSILFELFQNADDAYFQLERLNGAACLAPTTGPFFVVRCGEQMITVMHWGRRINYPVGLVHGEDPGYGRDLRNMLALSASDKEPTPGQETVTGRFGLGFKSVFAICDQPRVVSGRLGFEVLGGIYPTRLPAAEYDRMRSELAAVRERCSDGTIFELPLRGPAEPREVRKAVLGPFREAVHVLLAFSQQIKLCRLEIAGSVAETLSWRESAIGGSRNLFVGTLQLPDRPQTALLLETNFGSLLVRVGSKGLEPFNEDVPTVWVTAPTGERLNLGFAINAPAFDLDVGRIQLNPKSERNRELAEKLGGEIGQALVELFDVGPSLSWSSLRRTLNLAPDCEPYQFWLSVWELLAEHFQNRASGRPEAPTLALVRHTLWGGPEFGASRLYATRAALPTQIDAPGYQTLANASCVHHVLTGCIDANTPLVQRITRWDSFRQNVQQGTIVSESRCWRVLCALCPTLGKPVANVGLVQALEWEFSDRADLDPVRAAQLGEDLSGFLERIDEVRGDEEEEAKARRVLARGRFMAADSCYYPAKQLILATADSDESLRAQFAPADRVLADRYTEAGLALFLGCRGAMAAPTDELVKWALTADSDERKVAVLEYLLRGELRDQLASLLRTPLELLPEHWLLNIPESLLRGFDSRECQMLRLLLARTSQIGTPPPPPSSPPPQPPPLNPEIVLPRIYEWWTQDREHYVALFEKRFYARSRWPEIHQLTDWGDLEQRKAWLTLFILGACHTMGRAKPEQHRSFVELCEETEILPRLAEAERDPAGWLSAIERYAANRAEWIEYFHWMKQLLGSFLVARNLSNYGEAFLEARFHQRFPMSEIISPNTSKTADFSAPSLAQVLGNGACFIMRELARNNVNNNPHCHEHCYVPHARVRRLLAQLGCQGIAGRENPDILSKQIHAFLCKHLGAQKATFHRCFDLPFFFLAYETERKRNQLHKDLFGRVLILKPRRWSEDGDFVTLSDGRRIPRWWMS